jgi:hypothetical protein
MPEDGQRGPGDGGTADRGRPGAGQARQDAGGDSPPGDGRDHAGTPRPDALIPVLDEGPLAALREIGRERDRVSADPQGVAARAASRPVPGRVPRGQPGPPGPVHPVRACRGTRRAAAADPDHERFRDAAHAAGPGRAGTEAAGRRPAAGRRRDRGAADAQAGGAAGAAGGRAVPGRLRAPGDAGRPGPGRPTRLAVLAARRRGDRVPDAGGRGSPTGRRSGPARKAAGPASSPARNSAASPA